MDQKAFLTIVSEYNLATYGFFKRLFPKNSLKEIKECIRENEAQGFIKRHEYKGFDCFSLSKSGFQVLRIEHSPKFELPKEKAALICFVNQLRYGMSEEIKNYKNIEWSKWVSGGRFAVRPLVVRRRDREERILPEGMLAVREPGELCRLWFIHHWRNPEQIRRDLFLYSLYEKSERHIYRFFLSDGTNLRVLCLIPDMDTLKQAAKYLRRDKVMGTALFPPFSRTAQPTPLSSKIWFDISGKKRSVI